MCYNKINQQMGNRYKKKKNDRVYKVWFTE